MRNIKAGLFITADGVIEAPETWSFQYGSAQIDQHIQAMMGTVGTMLLGRVTYQTFEGAFSQQQGGIADIMNGFQKVVVSGTLADAGWANSTLLSGDVAGGIRELKNQAGGDIVISGSATLTLWLLREGLLDELDLLVCPVVLGKGRRLFPETGDQIPLRLVTAETFDKGVQHIVYTRA
jgi:dihydrofolate reductase